MKENKPLARFKMILFSIMFLFCSMTNLNAAHIQLGSKIIKISENNINLNELVWKIKKLTGYEFVCDTDDLSRYDDVTIKKEGSIEQILDEAFEDTDLTYYSEDNIYIIKKKDAVSNETFQQEKKKIKGKVTDEKGVPLPGVSVIIKGTSIGAATNIDGEYSLEVENSNILLISFMGMTSQTVEIVENKSVYDVVLKEATEQLQEVVVTTGYGKIDRKLFTGSAVKLKAEDAKVDGVADVGRMLEGKVAGVQVQSVSGTFGAAPKIRIRGASSIYGDTKPLWVVDGVILEDVVDISPDQLSSGDASTLISSSVAGINADDIESFSILKDASATALYGARAMNGVIVITTKKGTVGKPRVNVTSELTVKAKPNYAQYDIMNSQEQISVFREMERKGWLQHADMMNSKNGGIYFRMYDLVNTFDERTGKFGLENTESGRANFLRGYEYANTDWFDLLFRNSISQQHSVSVSSGSENSTFYVSTSMLNDSGWTIADDVNRYTINMRGEFDLNDKLTIGLMTKGSIREQKAPGTFNRSSNDVDGDFSREFDINPFSFALNSSRTLKPYGSDGDLEYYRMNYAPFNVLSEYKNHFIDLSVVDLSIQGELGYKISPHMDYKFIGSVRYVKSTSEHQIKENSNVAGAYRAAGTALIAEQNRFLFNDLNNPLAQPKVILPNGGFYNTEDNSLTNYFMRHMLNFNKTYDEVHSVNWMSGFEVKYSDRQRRTMLGYGYQYDAGGTVNTEPDVFDMLSQGGVPYFSMSKFKDRYVAGFANLAYAYKGKYSVNVTGRIDGSNRMGASQSARWLPTWNVSGKWNIKEESFLQDVNWLSFLQVRGTYGLTASMGPARNSEMILRNSLSLAPFADDRQNSIRIESLANTDLTWEKQYEANVGLDFGLFNNRVSVQMDAYKRNSFDLIAAVRTNAIGGEGLKFANYADMDSKGIEFTLNTRNVVSPNGLNWTSNLTFSYNKNEITDLKTESRIIDLVYPEGGALEGGPVRGLYSIPFAGLTNEGIPEFYTADGEKDQYVWFQDDKISHLKYEGPIDPKVTGGFGNVFKYKNWTLNAFTTFGFGNVIRLYPSFSASYSDMDAMSKDMNDRWLVAGDEEKTDIPGIISKRVYDKYQGDIEATFNAYNYSDRRVAKGDFVRLKQVSLSYKLPKQFIEKVGFANAEVKAQGANLWLLYSDKKLNGQDPEFFGAGGVALPVPRQYTFTLKLGF
jgi:TonB-linked SusC/RagA family outer membrane protein